MTENKIGRQRLDSASNWRVFMPLFTTPVLVCGSLFLTGYRSIGLILIWWFSGTMALAMGLAWHMLSPERRRETPVHFVGGILIVVVLLLMLCVSYWFDEVFWTWPVPWESAVTK